MIVDGLVSTKLKGPFGKNSQTDVRELINYWKFNQFRLGFETPPSL